MNSSRNYSRTLKNSNNIHIITMATKKTEKTEEVKKDVAKKTAKTKSSTKTKTEPKPKAAKEEKKQLTPEQSVVILACVNEDFLGKINKLAEKEGIEVVLTNEQVITDYVNSKLSEKVDESARMSAFLKDERNRKVAFAHANELFSILTHRKGVLSEASQLVFQKKDLVKSTTLSWKGAEEMLNTLQVFGFVIRLNKNDFRFQFDQKSICEQIRSDVAFSVESLNLDIQRYKGAVENSNEDDKEKMLADFKAEVQKHIVF